MRNFQFSIFNFQKFKTKLNQTGISLVEIVVAMAVLVILMGMIIFDQQLLRANQQLDSQVDFAMNTMIETLNNASYAARNVATTNISKYEWRIYQADNKIETHEFNKQGADALIRTIKLREIEISGFTNFKLADNPKILRSKVIDDGQGPQDSVTDNLACIEFRNKRGRTAMIRISNWLAGSTAATKRFDRVNSCSAEATPFVPPGVPGGGGGIPTPPTPTAGQFVIPPTVGPCVQVFRSSPSMTIAKNGVRLFGTTALALNVAPVRDFDIDSDSDGICDSTDPCPFVAGSNNGCPPFPTTATDSDGDGVIDSNDLCPSVAGSPAFDGCPNPLPLETPVPTNVSPTAAP